MTIFTVLIDALTLVVCGIAISGCGKEVPAVTPNPDPTVSTSSPSVATNDPVADPTAAPTAAPTATATPTPNPTTVTYNFQDITICTYLHTWDPIQTTIKTFNNGNNGVGLYSFTYLLQWNGAFVVSSGGCENGCAAPDADLIRSNINGTVCTIHIRNGQYAGVTP